MITAFVIVSGENEMTIIAHVVRGFSTVPEIYPPHYFRTRKLSVQEHFYWSCYFLTFNETVFYFLILACNEFQRLAPVVPTVQDWSAITTYN